MKPRSGTTMMTIGTLASGVLAYVFNVVAARTLGADDYGPIAVLWAGLFLVSQVLFRPIEQTLCRGIADRLAHGADAKPVLRAVTRLTIVVGAAAVAAVLAAWVPLTNRMFAGEDVLTAALAVGLAGYALSFFVRGIASGLQWLHGYGLLLLGDGGVRLALALPLFFVASPAIAAAAVAIAATAGAVVPFLDRSRRVRGRGERPLVARLDGTPRGPFELGHALRFATPVAVISACDQILVSGGALLVALTGGAGAAAAAGTVFAATMLVRAPVFLFQGFAAVLLPSLTRQQAVGDDHAFRRHIAMATGLMLAFAAVLTMGTLVYGPESMRFLYGEGFGVHRADLALLAAGVGGYLVSATFSQAALARGMAARASGIWTASAVTFVAVELAMSGSPFHKVAVAFIVATTLNTVLFLALVMRRRRPAERAVAPRVVPTEQSAQTRAAA